MNEKKQKKKNRPTQRELITALTEGAEKTDPMGSYTGVVMQDDRRRVVDKDAVPVQDADDL